mgnify:FL=1
MNISATHTSIKHRATKHVLTKVSLLIGLMFSTGSMAQTVSGTITDNQGNKISGAKVRILDSKQQVTTNKNGDFHFANAPDKSLELHITASGYAHINKHIALNDGANVAISLARSAIEVIDVKATPFHASVMEASIPVSVLSGEKLRQQQASTLGDTLEKQVGVHTNFHAGVASTPIIRGLSGPRVMITQNGLDVSDVSRVGPDHSVATEASTATQIEVLRGPATLFFGSGAIGGVVNVVDERVPTNNTPFGEFILEKNSVNNQKLAAFNVKNGTDSFAFYADGFWRESDDYRIPEPPKSAASNEHHNKVENSAEESNSFTLGGSYLFDQGYVGLSAGKLNREYGIPGHTHGEEETHEDEHDHDEESEPQVFADLEQNRYQLIGEYNFDDSLFSVVNFKASYTDYKHAEIEAGAVGTTFANDTTELKVDLLHHPIMDWRGGISVHAKDTDVEAIGSEAFTPPSTQKMIALAMMQERHFDNILVQFGARVERVTLDAKNVRLPHLEAHGHDESGEAEVHDHDHGHEEESAELTRVFAVEQTFTPVTTSLGVVWDFTEGYNVGASISRSQRAPSASELLSFGPHIGTRSYEVGALFALNDHHEVALNSQAIDLETANNIDISFRKTQGDVAVIVNAFYNQVDNYYYQVATGLFGSDGHDHHGHDHGGHSAGELPVYIFKSQDATLHGFEAQVNWNINEELSSSFFADYVRARLKNGGDLPRTPPLRFGTNFRYQLESFSAHLDITRYQEQDKVANLETTTSGYTLVDLGVSYQLPLLDHDITFYATAKNLTDEYAKVHSSFVKDIAPRQGRSLAVGLRAYF